MTPKELFGVAVRVIGLLMILSSLWLLFGAFVSIALGGPNNGIGAFIFGIPSLVISLLFLASPNSLVNYAYSETLNERMSKEIEKRLRE